MIRVQYMVIIAISLLLLNSLNAEEHRCQTSSLVGEIKMIEDSVPNQHHGKTVSSHKQKLLNAEPAAHPMKFVGDYTNVPEGPIRDSFKAAVENYVFPRLSKIFKVSVGGTIARFNSNDCRFSEEDPFLQNYFVNTTEGDPLILFFFTEDTSVFGQAFPCFLLTATNRPVVGRVQLGPFFKNIDSLMKMQFLQDVVTHELLHAMGLVPGLFDRFTGGAEAIFKEITKTNADGKNSTIFAIIAPHALAWARTHFNCPTMEYIPLEDEGSAGSVGSHWETTLFSNELMTASHSGGVAPLSQLTLEFFKDMGFYEVDSSQGESLTFGKNAGCGFLNHQCSTQFREFCSPSPPGCSQDFLRKEVCHQNRFSNSCSIRQSVFQHECTRSENQQDLSLTGESIEVNSRCYQIFNDNSEGAGCYSTGCQEGKVTFTVETSADDNEQQLFECESPGQVHAVAEGFSIRCPENLTGLCDSIQFSSCPANCGGNGVCLKDKTCLCNLFSTGIGCSLEKECPFSQPICDLSPFDDQISPPPPPNPEDESENSEENEKSEKSEDNENDGEDDEDDEGGKDDEEDEDNEGGEDNEGDGDDKNEGNEDNDEKKPCKKDETSNPEKESNTETNPKAKFSFTTTMKMDFSFYN